MRILHVNVEVPFPPVGGGMTRTYHLLKSVASRHEVVLVGYTYGLPRDRPPFPVKVIEVPWQLPPLYQAMQGSDPAAADRAFAILDREIPEPWFASYFDCPAMTETLRDVLCTPFDLVVVDDASAKFLSLVPAGIPRLLGFDNVNSLMARRNVERSTDDAERTRAEAERTLGFERAAADRADHCFVCSQPEAQAVRELLGDRPVSVIPNGVDTEFFQPSAGAPEDQLLVFPGSMSYAPNVEAVLFFANEILPRIHARFPRVRFEIVGAKPTPEVQRLAGERVTVTGTVPDIRPYLHRATAIVVPLLSGGGTRLKILDAAASGKAIVTTTLGVEGLEFERGRDLLVADTPAAFANAVVRVIEDAGARRSFEQHARAQVLRYGWPTIEEKFATLVAQFDRRGATDGAGKPAKSPRS